MSEQNAIMRDIDKTNPESFVNVESELKDKSFSFNGYLMLESAEIEEPEDIPISENLDYDEYIVFTSQSDSIVIIPAYTNSKDHKFVLDWAEVDSFSGLCGKSIPVESIDEKTDRENVYKPATGILESNFIGDINESKMLMNDDYINYDVQDREWKIEDKFRTNLKLSLLILFSSSYFLTSLITSVLNLPINPLILSMNFIFSICLMVGLAYITDVIDIWGYPVYRLSHKILSYL